jgi:hypothetical protein
MGRAGSWVSFLVITLSIAGGAASMAEQPATTSAALDYDYFKTKVQPIFLANREGHARCIACHANATGMRLQPVAAGAAAWTEEDSRKNFESVRRMVQPGDPLKSRLLVHPLAEAAGGDFFHNGGKHFTSQKDREWSILKDWVMGAKGGN